MNRADYDRLCQKLWQSFASDDDLDEMLTNEGGLMDFVATIAESYGKRERELLGILASRLYITRNAMCGAPVLRSPDQTGPPDRVSDRAEYDRLCQKLWQSLASDDDLDEMLTEEGGLRDFVATIAESYGKRGLELLIILASRLREHMIRKAMCGAPVLRHWRHYCRCAGDRRGFAHCGTPCTGSKSRRPCGRL
jgi:hypothetical protein